MRKVLIFCSLVAFAVCAFAATQPTDPKLASLPAAAQSAFSARIGYDNPHYSIVPAAGGSLLATNSDRRISFAFGNRGVEARTTFGHWALQLGGVGYGASLKPVISAAPEAQANRVEYKRGPITEWYLNGPIGLEQGFTLNQRPAAEAAGQPLTVALTLSGNLQASVNGDASSLTLTGNGEHLQYSGLTAFDADGKELHSWLELRGAQLLLHVTDAQARYPVVIDPFIQVAILTATDNPYNYGISVAMSGNTIVVGSSTAAYVYVKPSSGWTSATQMARLTASDGTSLGAVSISGNTIVAAAGFFDSQATSTGEAFVFVEPSTGWTDASENAVLTASDATSGSDVGTSVSINGNVIAVGAVESNSVGSHVPPPDSGAGAVYVYVRPAGGWVSMTETAKLTSSDGVAGDDLGFSVAVGNNVIVAGAPDHDVNGGFVTGATYVYVKPASGWATATQTAELSVINESDSIAMGSSVAISGNTIVAGSGYGGAWVYVEPAGGWVNATQSASLTDSAPLITTVGLSVAICNNVIVAGGRAMADVYFEPAGGWANMSQTWRLPSPNFKVDGNYGNSVAIQGLTITVGFPQQAQTSGNQVFVWGPS